MITQGLPPWTTTDGEMKANALLMFSDLDEFGQNRSFCRRVHTVHPGLQTGQRDDGAGPVASTWSEIEPRPWR